MVGYVLLFFLVFIVLSYCVSLRSEFHVVMSVMISALKRCSVRLYLQLFMSYLRYLCLLAHSGVQHLLCCVCLHLAYPMLPVSLDCLRLVYPMLPVSLDCLRLVYPMLPVSLDCLRLVYPMLSVSLDCLFLITLSVFSIIYIRSTQNIFLSADLLKNIETLPDFQNLLYRHLFTSLCSYYFIDTSEHCSRHPRYIYFTLNVLTEILLQANGSETLVLVLHFHWMISKNKCEICNQVL